MPSDPPTAYKKPPNTATATPSLRVLMDATRVHLFSFGSYLQGNQRLHAFLVSEAFSMTREVMLVCW